MPKLFGVSLVLGSGKSGTPCERMHADYLTSDVDAAAVVDVGMFEEPHPPTASVHQITVQTTLKVSRPVGK
jgi:hypothetical protein